MMQKIHAHSLAATLLLVTLYLYTFVLAPVQHSLVHAQLAAHVHTPATEADPCHQAMYHNAQLACQHAIHFEAITTKCAECNDHISTWEELVDIEALTIHPADHFQQTQSPYLEILSSHTVASTKGRAPPHMI